MEALIKILKNEQLIETSPSLEGLAENPDITDGSSIYLGTGLSTHNSISIGLPFDVLSMMLTAEKIKKGLGMKGIFHQIADTHAKSNHLVDDSAIDRLAKEQRELLLRIAERLNLQDYHILLASETENDELYRELLPSIKVQLPDDMHEYRVRELTDIEWFRVQKNMALKIGWIIDSGNQDSKFDERSYDKTYREKINNLVSFVYVKAGRTLDRKRPKASPYISIAGESRILFQPGENATGKLSLGIKDFNGDRPIGGALKYYNAILRVYQDVVGKLESRTVEDKIQEILDKVLS